MDVRTAGSAKPLNRLPTPDLVNFRKIAWVYAIGVIGYHLVALLALLPWFFSWTGVVLAIAGCYVFGTLGINLCYHRLLTHRGFNCPKWLEHGLRDPGRLLPAGHARPLGGGASPASPALRRAGAIRTARWSASSGATWAGSWSTTRTWTRLRIYDRYAKDMLQRSLLPRAGTQRPLDLDHPGSPGSSSSWAALPASCLLGGTPGQALQFGLEPADLGRVRPHRPGLAYHLVGELGDAPVGLSQLRDRRGEPQQSPDRAHQQRRGLAQQPPRRSPLGRGMAIAGGNSTSPI